MSSAPSVRGAAVIATLLLTACSGGSYGTTYQPPPVTQSPPADPVPPTQSPPADSPPQSPPADPPRQAGVMQFATTNLTVSEHAAAATATISRSGGSEGAVSVKLTSSDGSAIAAQDYAAVDTIVTLAAGETAKSFVITIADDEVGEDSEVFNLALSEPTGGAALGQSVGATVTIENDDAPAAPVITGITAQPKQLIFSWPRTPGVVRYQLLADRAGNGDFEVVPVKISAIATTIAIDIAVHGLDWMKAKFQLQACNSYGCGSSTPKGLDSQLMMRAIGTLKLDLPLEDIPEFGWSVALSGDGRTLAVGTPYEQFNDHTDSGVVYVFDRAAGGWSEPRRLPIGDGAGSAVALDFDGSTLVVGCIGEARVLERIDGQWAQLAEPLRSPANPSVVDNFGSAVALSDDGDTIAVGAPGMSDVSHNYAGTAYVYARHGTTWSAAVPLQAEAAADQAHFGASLALDEHGTTLAVGAPSDDLPLAHGYLNKAGSVTVFRQIADQWIREPLLTASNADAGDFFGNSVDLSSDGNTLVAGAPLEDSGATGTHPAPVDAGPANASGAVYVFTRETIWTETAYVKASNTGPEDLFGVAVALSSDGNTLAVGATGEASSSVGVGNSQLNNDAAYAGAVYTYSRAGATWLPQAYVKASDTTQSDLFGLAVALDQDGDTLAVGAPFAGEDVEHPSFEWTAGAVYVY